MQSGNLNGAPAPRLLEMLKTTNLFISAISALILLVALVSTKTKEYDKKLLLFIYHVDVCRYQLIHNIDALNDQALLPLSFLISGSNESASPAGLFNIGVENLSVPFYLVSTTPYIIFNVNSYNPATSLSYVNNVTKTIKFYPSEFYPVTLECNQSYEYFSVAGLAIYGQAFLYPAPSPLPVHKNDL